MASETDERTPEEVVNIGCACRHDDARTCYEIRYPPPMDDLQRDDYFAMFGDEECQCCCHDERYEEDYDDFA